MISQSFFNMIMSLLLIVIICIAVGELIIYLVLKHVKTDKITKVFGLFMELNNTQIFNISISLIKYIFIWYCLFSTTKITTMHLYILSILSLLFGVSSLSLKNFSIDAMSIFPLYLGFVCKKLFQGYLKDVMYVWYVYWGNILLTIFIILYSTFFVLKYINDMISKNQYIRRFRNDK